MLDRTERPLTPEEQTVVDRAREAALKRHSALQSGPWELGAPGAGLLVIGLALWGGGFGVGPFLAAGGALMVLGAIPIAVKNARQAPTPGLHDRARTAIEYALTARRAVFALDDRGDGQLYILLELPDGRWHLLVDEMLAWDAHLLATLSHQRIFWSETETGLPLRVWSEGDAIPTRGVDALDDDGIEAAIDAGCCWSPEHLEGDTFPADLLPDWVTDWSTSPPADGTAA